MTINIGSRGTTETEKLLSNFAHTPFHLNGVVYESIEGFWQSLKFPKEEDRKRVAAMHGLEAKRAGRDAPQATHFYYQDKKIAVGSSEHHELMRQALRAKLRRNPKVMQLLLQTGKEPLTHILYNKEGKRLPDSKTIPAEVFCGYLVELREEFRRIHGDGKHIAV
jgi:predicted NAD-dependent protein-ADP-ribosyltransferase YbiA (DUF1768 family)